MRGVASAPLCSNDPQEVVAARVRDYLSRCYVPVTSHMTIPAGNTYMSRTLTLNYQVTESYPWDHGSRFGVYAARSYTLVVDVRAGEAACATSVESRASNEAWARRFASIEQAANGATPACSR